MSADSGPLRLSTLNGVKVYHCTAGKTLPQWRQEYKGRERAMRQNDEYRGRIELIHDFDFPGAANRVKLSPDGRYIAALGTYKPRIKLFECENMSLKVERFSDDELIQMQFLTDDFSKLALARADQHVELHTAAGQHARVRVPRHIRDLFYHRPTCDLFIASNGPELYRLNLEQGSFLSTIETRFVDGMTCLGSNPAYPLLAVAGANGVECWDHRDRSRASYLDLVSTISSTTAASKHQSILRAIQNSEQTFEATALRFDESGMNISVGTSSGHIFTYDIRSSTPLHVLDHRYDLPIHSVKYHNSSGKLISADHKVVRIWDAKTGGNYSSITPPAPLNDLTLVGESGMMLMACESPQMHIYFMPSLGSVPDWCAHLESLTEELEETTQDVYDDYKFITHDQLQEWGLSHLIGTNLLRSYMHGFFIHTRLYDQVRSVLDTQVSSYDQYLSEQVRKKVDAKREGGFKLDQYLPQVNKEYAETLVQTKAPLDPEQVDTKNPLGDDRFAAMFEDEDFSISMNDDDYLRMNPQGPKRRVADPTASLISKPQGLDSDLLADEGVDIMASRIPSSKRVLNYETQGILGASGLVTKDADREADTEEDTSHLTPREKKRKEREAKAKLQAELEAEQVRQETLALLSQRKQYESSRHDAFMGSLKGVRAGVGVRDVLASSKDGTNRYAGLSLAERVKREEQERIRKQQQYEREQANLKRQQEREEKEAREAKRANKRQATSGRGGKRRNDY